MDSSLYDIKSPASAPCTGRILVVDDSEDNRALMRAALEIAGYEVRDVSSGLACLDALKVWTPDCILLDVMMPGLDGIETCLRIRERYPSEPIAIVFVTALHGDEAIVVSALSAGGDDLLTRPYSYPVLQARIRSQTKWVKQARQLRALANTDPLTSASTRRHLYERMSAELRALAASGEGVLGCVMVDIDHFKQINDTLGHAEGDRVLERFVPYLRARLPAGAIVARFGGEEFVVVFRASMDAECAAIAEGLRAGLVKDEALGVSASFGVAGVDGRARVALSTEQVDVLIESLLRQADEALYRAKAAGRNRVERMRFGTFPALLSS